jgi:CelD/BcsL family acetyltransferase involved in cellulose biosynthesis
VRDVDSHDADGMSGRNIVTTIGISDALTVQVSDCFGLPGLSSLADEWREMALRQEQYFLDYDWFRESIIQDSYPAESLRLVVVRQASGRMLGVVPLEQRVERIRRMPFRIWAMVGSRFAEVAYLASGSDYLCSSPELRQAVLRAALVHLSRTSPRCSLLLLGRMPEGSEALAACRVMQKRYLYVRGAVDWIAVERSYREFHSGLSRKFKAALRSASNRATAMGGVRFDWIDAGHPEHLSAYEQFKRLEASGWKGESGKGGALGTPQSSAQRRLLDSVFSQETAIRPIVHRMSVGNECVSALIAVRSGGTLAVLKIAHNESFRRISPGHLLIRDLLERSCIDPSIAKIDMVSHTDWIGSWRPDTKAHFWCYLPLRPILGAIPMALLRLPQRSTLKARFDSV